MTWSREILDTVRERADLVEIAEARGAHLTGSGKTLQGTCPLCGGSSTTNRFTIWTDRGRWKCYSCRQSGDAIRLVQLVDGLDFPSAARAVAKTAAVLLPEWRDTPEGRARLEIEAAAERCRAAFALALRHWAAALPSAAEYLRERDLEAIAAEHGFGYAAGDGELLRALEAAEIPRADRVRWGLTAERDGREFETYRRRLVVPLEDHHGRLCGFAARDLSGKAKAKYLNTPEIPGVFLKRRLLYGWSTADVRKTGRAVLVEGQLDALRAQAAGLAAVAPMGSELTDHQADELARVAREVVLFFDGDAAGRKATDEAAQKLLARGLGVRVALLPDGEDPDAWLRVRGFEELPVVEWVSSWAERNQGAPAHERERLLLEVLRPALSSIGPAAAETIAGTVARAWSISPRAVLGAPSPLVSEGERGEGSELDELLEELNARHFVVPINAKTAVACVRPNGYTGLDEIHLATFDDFRNLYSNRVVEIPPENPRRPPKREPLGRWWVAHPRRRQYAGLVFLPGKPAPEGQFNTWRGWAVEPAPGECGLYREHIRRVICAGRADLALWVWRWMAHAIQRPWELPGTALVLRGLQGTGKGFFVDTFSRLFGPHALAVYSNELLAGRFNGHLRDILLIHSNEATWGGDKVQEGILKGLVTDPFVPIESKGFDALNLPNFRRVIFSTNHEYPVARDADDRRFLVLDVSPEKQSADYFSALHAEMNGGGLAALLWDLQREPLEGWTPRQVPRSENGWDIKIRSLSGVGQWWHECLTRGATVTEAGDDGDEWAAYPGVQELHRAYLRWCDRMNRRSRETLEEMGRTLRKMVPHLGRYRPRAGGGPRKVKYSLGDLEECRRAFELALREGPYMWPKELDEGDAGSSAPAGPSEEDLAPF